MLARMTRYALVALAALLANTSPSAAGVIVVTGPPGVNTDENILFNEAGLVSTGTTVTGVTNQSDAVLNISTTSSYTLTTPSGGQARVERDGGGLYDGLIFTPNTSPPSGLNPMTNFTNFEFNVNAAADGTMNLQIFLNGSNTAALNSNYALDQSGQNFFGIQSNGGDVITKIQITTTNPTPNIELVRQIRIGGVNTPVTTTTGETTSITTPTTTTSETTSQTTSETTAETTSITTPTGGNAVPEPLTLALWGGLGGGMMLFGRRRKATA